MMFRASCYPHLSGSYLTTQKAESAVPRQMSMPFIVYKPSGFDADRRWKDYCQIQVVKRKVTWDAADYLAPELILI